MARRTKEEAEETRGKILMAALDLFSEKGYSRTTLANIATHIGMTRGAVYWHFAGKSDLLAAMMNHMFSLKDAWIRERVPKVKSVADLREVYVLHAQLIENDPLIRKFEYFLNFRMEWDSDLIAETHQKLSLVRVNPVEFFTQVLSRPAIRAQLRPDVDVGQVALALASLGMGACKITLGLLDFKGEAHCAKGTTFEELSGAGFDFIMNGVLNEGNEHE